MAKSEFVTEYVQLILAKGFPMYILYYFAFIYVTFLYYYIAYTLSIESSFCYSSPSTLDLTLRIILHNQKSIPLHSLFSPFQTISEYAEEYKVCRPLGEPHYLPSFIVKNDQSFYQSLSESFV